MRTVNRIAATTVLWLATGCTVVQHMYVAEGLSGLSYRDRQFVRSSEMRLGFTIDSLPTWAFGVSAGAVAHPDHSETFASGCYTYVNEVLTNTGCYPHVIAAFSALDVQKRWRPARMVHPLASLAVGQLRTRNIYRGSNEWRVDSARASGIVALSGGGELNIARWLHLSVSAGYREVFRSTTPLGAIAPSGFTLTSLLLFGKPYR